jgi:hypothetical protein
MFTLYNTMNPLVVNRRFGEKWRLPLQVEE